jgi:hypothetical protein
VPSAAASQAAIRRRLYRESANRDQLFEIVERRREALHNYLEWAKANDNEQWTFRMSARPGIRRAACAAHSIAERRARFDACVCHCRSPRDALTRRSRFVLVNDEDRLGAVLVCLVRRTTSAYAKRRSTQRRPGRVRGCDCLTTTTFLDTGTTSEARSEPYLSDEQAMRLWLAVHKCELRGVLRFRSW